MVVTGSGSGTLNRDNHVEKSKLDKLTEVMAIISEDVYYEISDEEFYDSAVAFIRSKNIEQEFVIHLAKDFMPRILTNAGESDE